MGAISPRPNELTAVVDRDLFDEFPAEEGDAADRERWRGFVRDYASAQELAEPSAFPLQVDFELTSSCNMKCSFCTHGHELVPRRLLPFADFARVIDEGREHGLCSIKLNYINEPLLTRDLPRYIRYARDRGVLNVYFATNGTMLDGAMAGSLLDAGVSKVMVSLDATTPGTFREVRRSEHFGRIVSNVVALIRLRDERGLRFPLVRVNFLKTGLNAHEAEDFLARWRGVADMVGYQEQVGVPGVDGPLHIGEDTHAGREGFRCAFPFKLVVVDSSGLILPCCTFGGREMPIGDLENDTIASAWQGGPMRSLRRLHLEGRYADNPVCRHCIDGT